MRELAVAGRDLERKSFAATTLDVGAGAKGSAAKARATALQCTLSFASDKRTVRPSSELLLLEDGRVEPCVSIVVMERLHIPERYMRLQIAGAGPPEVIQDEDVRVLDAGGRALLFLNQNRRKSCNQITLNFLHIQSISSSLRAFSSRACFSPSAAGEHSLMPVPTRRQLRIFSKKIITTGI